MKKKWLIAIASAAMAVTVSLGIAACSVKKAGSAKSDVEVAQTIINNLDNLYLGKDAETPSDFKRLGQYKVENKIYDVLWSADVKTEGYDENVKIGTKDSSGQITIGITRATVDIEYTLTASVTVGKVTKTTSPYNHKIPAKTLEDSNTATLSFATTDARVSLSSAQQVWKQGNFTLTNDKGSGSNIADYSNPVRFYKGSILKLEFPGLVSVTFHCSIKYSGDNYASSLEESLKGAYPDATITSDDETGVTTFVLSSPVNSIQFTLTKSKVFMDSIDVEGQKGGLTDAQKVAGAKTSLKLAQDLFFEENTVELTTESNGAKIAWSIKETTTNASVVEGKQLKVTTLPTAETTLTLVAAISSGDESDTAEFPITLKPTPTLVHKGTQADPFSVADAIAISELLPSGGYYMKNGENARVYVKGYIIAGTWSTQFGNFDGMYIADDPTTTTESDEKVQVFGLKTDSQYITEQGDLPVGVLVTVVGGLQNFKGTSEVSLQPETVALEDTRTPETQLQAALASIKDITVSKTGDVELTTSHGDVTFTWALKSGSTLPDGTTFASATSTLTVTTLPAETTTVTFEVTGHLAGTTDQKKDVTVTINKESAAPQPGEALEAGDYNIVLRDEKNADGTNNLVWYVTGVINNKGGLTVDKDASKAATITVSIVSGKYVLKIGEKYLEAYLNLSGNYKNMRLVDTPSSDAIEWKWNTDYQTFSATYSDETRYLGGNYFNNQVGNLYDSAVTLSKEMNFTGTNPVKICYETATGGSVTPGPDEPEVPTGTFTPITTPAEGTDYYLGMDVKGTYRYLTGNMSGFYFETTTDVSEAAKVALEKSGNGWVLKVNSQFIEIEYALGTDKKYHTNVKFNATQTSNLVWEWNETHKVFTMKANDKDYYLGSYTNSDEKTFETMSASELTHITNATSYPAHLGTFVEGSEPAPEKTPDEKVAQVKNALTVNFTNFKAVNAEIDLDEVVAATKASEYGVSVAWEITEPATGADVWVKVEGNKLKLVSLPDASKNFTLTARLTLTGATDATKEFNFTLQPEGQDEPEAGSAEKPFTPSEAVTYGKANLTTNGATTQQEVYATGYVIDAGSWKGTYWQYVYIADDASYTTATKYADSVIEVFKLYPDNTYLKLSGDLIKGMQITVHGHLKNYTTTGNSPKTTYEFDDYKVDEDTVHPVVSATTVTREQRVEAAKALVGNLANDDVIASFDLPDTAISGISYEWSVTPTTYAQVVTEQGKSKVKITRPAYGTNNQKATLSLKITCDGTEEQTPLTWELTIKQKPSTTEESELYILPSAHQNSGSSNSYTGNCDVTYNGVTWNVEGNSQIQPWRFGGKAASKEETATFSRKLTSKTAIQGKVSKIVLTLTDGGNITVNSVTLKVYDGDPTSDSAQEVASKDLGTYTKDQEVTINADEGGWTNCYYVIIFNVSITGTSNRWVGISSLEFRGTAVEE